MGYLVEKVAARDTHRLRQAVLRPYQSLEEIAADDRLDGTIFAAVDDVSGEVVSTASIFHDDPPAALAATITSPHPWRLRAVATKDGLRRNGLGAAVFDAVLEHVAALGGGLLWCNARIGVCEFYERLGFQRFGEVFIEEPIGPHVVMWRMVDDRSTTAGSTTDRRPPPDRPPPDRPSPNRLAAGK